MSADKSVSAEGSKHAGNGIPLAVYSSAFNNEAVIEVLFALCRIAHRLIKKHGSSDRARCNAKHHPVFPLPCSGLLYEELCFMKKLQGSVRTVRMMDGVLGTSMSYRIRLYTLLSVRNQCSKEKTK